MPQACHVGKTSLPDLIVPQGGTKNNLRPDIRNTVTLLPFFLLLPTAKTSK